MPDEIQSNSQTGRCCNKLYSTSCHVKRSQGRRKGARARGRRKGALGARAPPTFKVMRKSALFKKGSALFAWLTITLVCPSERYEIVAE